VPISREQGSEIKPRIAEFAAPGLGKRGSRLDPLHRLKLNADYSVTYKWLVGGNVVVASDQYYFGDQSNENPPLSGYAGVRVTF